ncbi:hypothetical protein SCHPADRAFT_328586 [Schizopora paradoxa]|uniref:F-box domain-containing protein n=1 Tax=Schizopora paradoxa TaxID=27342 RepID=A0A0H2RR87_9AGAM|nr:hypothetical protein SCHPADRAFT_328586 [Schizopora paradoxa]
MSSDISSRLFNSRDVQCITPVLEGFRFVNTTDLNWCPSNEASVKRAELSTFTMFRSQLLSSLHFIGMTIPRSSIPTSMLTSLALTLVETIASTEQYLRDVLSDTPSLTSLSLDLWSIHDMSVDEGPNPDTILLPELRYLTMRGTCYICWRISRTLSVPSINEICIKTGRSPLQFASNFIPFSPRGDRLRITIEKSKLQVEFVESESLRGGETTHFAFTILTGTEFHEGIRFCNNHVIELLQSRRFPKITAFEYSTSDNFDTTFMSKLLSHFTSLQELSLNFSCPMEWIVFRIQHTINLKLIRSPTPSPLQSLRKLVFQNFSVTFPQSVPYLTKLRSFTQGADGTGLPPLILEIKDREGVDDAILHACYASVGQDAADS